MLVSGKIVSCYVSVMEYLDSAQLLANSKGLSAKRINLVGGYVAQIAEYLLAVELMKVGRDPSRTHSTRTLSDECGAAGIKLPGKLRDVAIRSYKFEKQYRYDYDVVLDKRDVEECYNVLEWFALLKWKECVYCASKVLRSVLPPSRVERYETDEELVYGEYLYLFKIEPREVEYKEGGKVT